MMKYSYFAILLTLVLFISCKKEVDVVDFTTVSGTILNPINTTVSIANRTYSKTLDLDSSGKFKDTLHIDDGVYVLRNGESNIILELKVGYDLDLTYDAKKAEETLSFSGLGAVNNNYFADRVRLQETLNLQDFNTFFRLEKSDFDSKVNEVKTTLDNLISNASGLDSVIVVSEKRSNRQLISFLQGSYVQKHEILTKLAENMPSPTFNYPDINGHNVSLSSLKGKYVYIDVWATWCGPCRVQIPYLKELEEKYENKNIEFIGLSIDTQENKGKWETMVAERNLKGIQLLADKDWQSKFIQEYYITGIPRFILIDPKGNIVSPDAPRPSDPALTKLFDKLKI